jgi:8-oxo-dGTP pyrophosphatase MutT (NUDIX family)
VTQAPPPADVPVRDAATIILVRRQGAGSAQLLMGQRGAKAAFMPSLFVFPGGAVDREDVAFASDLVIDAETERLLAFHADRTLGRGLALAAIRELWEEAGLALACPDQAAPGLADRAPATLRPLLEAGFRPDARNLRFIFRAITPPGRPRRFDARFFMAEAGDLAGDPDDFTRACGELSRLQWLDLAAARALPLPFITEVVLAEVQAILASDGAGRPVPFFHHDRAGAHIALV